MPPWLIELLKLLPDILKGTAALLWPFAALILFLVFRKELQNLIRGLKLKRGKVLGQEFELEQEINKLARDTETFASIVVPAPTSEPAFNKTDPTRQVLTEAGASPKAALMLLAAELEAELRRFAESRGLSLGTRTTFRDSVEVLKEHADLPDEFLKSMIAFRDVRNKLVHGYETDPDNALRTIDVGLRLLRVLRSLSRDKGPTPEG